MRELLDACRWNNARSVEQILQNKTKKFDLIDNDGTSDNGIYFIFALKFQNVRMLNSLLDYYNQKELEGRDYDSMEYKIAKMKLRDVLKEASSLGFVQLTPEIKEIIKPYVESQCSEVDEDDRTLPDFYDEEADNLGVRESEVSADHSDDTLTLTKANLDLLGRVSYGDSSEEGL